MHMFIGDQVDRCTLDKNVYAYSKIVTGSLRIFLGTYRKQFRIYFLFRTQLTTRFSGNFDGACAAAGAGEPIVSQPSPPGSIDFSFPPPPGTGAWAEYAYI